MSEYGTSSDSPASTRVVEAVADELDTDPTELETPLAEVIDTDALDNLFKGPGSSAIIRFSYYGHQISVKENDVIILSEKS